MNSSIFLTGYKCLLRPMSQDDFRVEMPNWVSDREVTKYLVRGTYPLHEKEALSEYEALANNRNDIQLTIADIKSKKSIGVCGLHRIDWIARHAEFRILIGDKKFWNKGIGTEVNQLLVIYGFEILNMEKIWLGVNAANKGAHQSYLKAGFKQEGLLRNEVYRAGRYFDVVRMSLLRSEYEKLKKNNSQIKKLTQQINIGE